MKAAVLTELGNLDNIKYQTIPTPKPTADEVLVKAEYCGLNHLDLLIIQGKRPGPQSFPHILGSEFTGTVTSHYHLLYLSSRESG